MESDGEDANAARREPAAKVARVDGVELNKKAAAAESGICKGMPFANRGESEPPPTLLEDGKAGNDGEEHCDSEEWLATACVEAKDDEAENNSALEAQGIKALWGEPDSPPPWALHELQQDIQDDKPLNGTHLTKKVLKHFVTSVWASDFIHLVA